MLIDNWNKQKISSFSTVQPASHDADAIPEMVFNAPIAFHKVKKDYEVFVNQGIGQI